MLGAAILFGSISLIGVMLADTADSTMESPLPGIHLQPREVGEEAPRPREDLLAQGGAGSAASLTSHEYADAAQLK